MADTEHEEDKRCTLFDKPKRYCTAHMDWHAEDEFKEAPSSIDGGRA